MRLKVSFEIDIPEYATHPQAVEWIKWEIGSGSHICIDNPLDDSDLIAQNVRITG